MASQRRIQSRLTFYESDPIFDELAELGDNPRAIRARIKSNLELLRQHRQALKNGTVSPLLAMVLSPASSLSAIQAPQATLQPEIETQASATHPAQTAELETDVKGDEMERIDLSFVQMD